MAWRSTEIRLTSLTAETMKVAFIIERKSFYRLLAPIVDQALRSGWQVECWHDYGQPRSGPKASEFPSVSAVPAFACGAPLVRRFEGKPGLRQLFLRNDVDAVLALNTPARVLGELPEGALPRWVGIQSAADFFPNNGPRGILSCSVAAIYSDWWIQWGIRHFRGVGWTQPGDETEQRVIENVVPVGFPQLDPCPQIDPQEVRRRWNLSSDRPVVVLLPFPSAGGPGSFWARSLYLQPSRVQQLRNILRERRFEYMWHFVRGWHDGRFARAIRRFCDRNGALLVVKSRRKTPVPEHLVRIADRCLYDESHYPATILEALSTASLCISFCSMGVLEAAALAVPHLAVRFPLEDYYDGDAQGLRNYRLFHDLGEGGMFNFPGVSSVMGISDVIKSLPRMALSDFRCDAEARRDYVRKFLGYDDGQSSGRVLALLRSHSLPCAIGQRPTLEGTGEA